MVGMVVGVGHASGAEAVGGIDATGIAMGTVDGGHTWSRRPVPTGISLLGVACTSSSSCTTAGPGYYVPDAGATAPTPCPAGTSNPNLGATGSAACVVGIQVSTATLADATVSVRCGPVALQVAGRATGATLRWRKLSLPKGLGLSGAGILSGTPSTKLVPDQTYEVSVQVTGNHRVGGVRSSRTGSATSTLSISQQPAAGIGHGPGGGLRPWSPGAPVAVRGERLRRPVHRRRRDRPVRGGGG